LLPASDNPQFMWPGIANRFPNPNSAFLLLTVQESCKTQLPTNLTPQNGSKHFSMQGFTPVKTTGALATMGVVYDTWM